MVFGERLRQLREGKYSQEELADILHVHNITISKWENGIQEPRAKRVAELAKILGTTTAYLLGDTDDPSNEISSQSILHTRQQSSKEQSLNNGMFVYESEDGKRFEAPPTEEGMRYLERMFKLSMSGKALATA